MLGASAFSVVWHTWSEHEYTEKEQSMPLDHDAKMEDLHLCELSAPLVISLFFWSLRVNGVERAARVS